MIGERDKKGRIVRGGKPSKKCLKKLKEVNDGNEYALKIKDKKARQEAFEQYLKHLASGYPKDTWYFDHPDYDITWKTMEKYIKENPQEFPPAKFEQANIQRYTHWIKAGRDMMLGKYDKCQPAIYQMFMRNMFGWDRESKISVTYEPEARKFLAMLEGKNEDPKLE